MTRGQTQTEREKLHSTPRIVPLPKEVAFTCPHFLCEYTPLSADESNGGGKKNMSKGLNKLTMSGYEKPHLQPSVTDGMTTLWEAIELQVLLVVCGCSSATLVVIRWYSHCCSLLWERDEGNYGKVGDWLFVTSAPIMVGWGSWWSDCWGQCVMWFPIKHSWLSGPIPSGADALE